MHFCILPPNGTSMVRGPCMEHRMPSTPCPLCAAGVPRRYVLQVYDHADGKTRQMEVSEATYERIRHWMYPEPEQEPEEPPSQPEPYVMPRPYVCADCGHETVFDRGPCLQCRSMRIVLISEAERLFGADWRKAFDPPNQGT